MDILEVMDLYACIRAVDFYQLDNDWVDWWLMPVMLNERSFVNFIIWWGLSGRNFK